MTDTRSRSVDRLLDRFLGDPNRRRPDAPAARAALDALLAVPVDALSDGDLSVLDRACSAVLTAVRNAHARRAGWYASGEWDTRAPGMVKDPDRWPRGRAFHEQTLPHHLIDHPRKDRWRLEDGERVGIYVSEPYHLGPEDILRLARVIEDAWDVTIRPDRARHFPGRTMELTWRRRPEGVPPPSAVD